MSRSMKCIMSTFQKATGRDWDAGIPKINAREQCPSNQWISSWKSKPKVDIVAWPAKVRSSTTLASVTSKKVTYVGRLVSLLSGVPSIKKTSLTIQCSPARPQPTWKIHIEYHTKAITLNLPHSQQYLQNIKIWFRENTTGLTFMGKHLTKQRCSRELKISQV